MDLPIQLLSPLAQIPCRGSDGAAAFDLRAAIESPQWVPPGASLTVPTGLAVAVPVGHVLLLCSRSGHGAKGIRLANSVGVIDPDYRGEVRVMLANDGSVAYQVQPGERIAQALLLPALVPTVTIVETLPETKRGAGGFGSTGCI